MGGNGAAGGDSGDSGCCVNEKCKGWNRRELRNGWNVFGNVLRIIDFRDVWRLHLRWAFHWNTGGNGGWSECPWLYKSYTEENLTHITIAAYYNVDEAFLQAPTAAWGNLWDCRAALRKLVSSVYRESDLNLPFGKNGKFLFQLGYTPVVSDMKKIVQKTVALSFPKWALAVWDMDTATLYMVKYDRSH